ncbi:hypothetical protein JCM6882_007072 [Rhodosporidiobolus microsporus]
MAASALEIAPVRVPEPAASASTLPSPPLTPVGNSAFFVANSVADQTKESKSEKWNRRIKEGGCHFSLFIAGWGDASSGPLIPYIQAHYSISYTIVSMLFIGQMCGFLAAGLVNAWLTQRFGLGKVIVLGAVFQATAYALLIPAFPFGAFPSIYAVGGFGLALQDAQANVYVAQLPGAETKLGYLHGAYGLGAAVCPLAATAFASSGILFARFYSISFGIAVVNIGILLYAFRFSYRVDESEPLAGTIEAPGLPPARVQAQSDIELAERRNSTAATSLADKRSTADAADSPNRALPNLDTSLPPSRSKKTWKDNILYQTIWNRTTVFLCLFTFLYVGSEVAMGGWIVTFLINDRNGGSDAGYVATGFWLGLMLGRLVLNPLNQWVGERRIVFVYTSIALALEFAIWFADSLVGNAVVVGMIGVLMGPSYPILISVGTKIWPRRLHASAIAFVAALGQTGSAVFPFITGALAQRFNPIVLQPVMICLFVGQMAMWACVPRIAKKGE